MGSHEIVGLLIAAKADLEAQDPQGNTALHKSAQVGSVRCVGMLLEAGADAARCNFHRQTPLDIATLFDQQDCVQRLAQAGAKGADCHVAKVDDSQPVFSSEQSEDGFTAPDLSKHRLKKEEMDEIDRMGSELRKIQAVVQSAKAEAKSSEESEGGAPEPSSAECTPRADLK